MQSWIPQTPFSKSRREFPPRPSHVSSPNVSISKPGKHQEPARTASKEQRVANHLDDNRDVLSTVQASRPLFSSYIRIRSLAKSPQNPELQQARSELETTLSELSADLDDLVESVRAVEVDPYRYGLELEEVSRRRNLVNDVGAEVEEMRKELQRAVTDITAAAGAGKGGDGGSKGGAGYGSGLPLPEDFEEDVPPEDRDDDYYAALEEQRQTELMHEQDEQLDGVFRTVGNLREQANDMGRELEHQKGLIGEVDTLADRVGGKLQGGMSRMKHIVRMNEGECLRMFLLRLLLCYFFIGLREIQS